MPSSSLALPSPPPAGTEGPQCQGTAGLAWKWGLGVGEGHPLAKVSQCLSPPNGPRHPAQTSPVPGPVLGVLGARRPDLDFGVQCRVLGTFQGRISPQL